MNKQKKLISLILCLAFALSLSSIAFANESTEDALNRTAAELITVTKHQDANGSLSTTYTQLDVFAAAVYERYPDISPEALAEFIASYTGQDKESLGTTGVINLLQYDNITTKVIQVSLDSESNGEVCPYSLSDSDMTLVVSYSYTGLNQGTNNKFDIWTIATWKKYPSIRIQDILALATSDKASYDSGADDYGYVHQEFTCSVCGGTTLRNREVTNMDPTDGDLQLIYNKGRPYIFFNPAYADCDRCDSHQVDDVHFSAYLKYGIVVDGITSTSNAYANYGHATIRIGPGNMSVSYSNTGGIVFNGGFAIDHIDQFLHSKSILIQQPDFDV